MRVEGTAVDYFETGCEGVVWVLEPLEIPEDHDPRDHFVYLQAGDRLELIAPDGTIAFEGVIDEDSEIGYAEYPMNPGHGQPAALGLWIHWTQRGFQPDDWARYFIRREGEARYFAVVERDD